MINKIEIENFKCYSTKREIELSNITACVGLNSVGKSSFIQSLLLLRQVFDNTVKYRDTKRNQFNIALNDLYDLHLGTTSQILSSQDEESIHFKVNEHFVFNLTNREDTPLSLKINCIYDAEQLSEIGGIFADNIYYLNAERTGPKNYQNMVAQDFVHCGYHGEATYAAIYALRGQDVSDGRLFPYGIDTKAKKMEKQIEYWMNYIVPGVAFHFSQQDDLRISSFQVMQQALDTGYSSPYNYGFGISYILPVIVSGLMAEKGSMFIVENPEAHLHPSGQSRIGSFLTQVAADGVQVVVETHSEHIINGIRIAALRNKIPAKDICINYFSINEEISRNQVMRINLNDRMDIIEWPDGFLDQEEKDLRQLREMRRK